MELTPMTALAVIDNKNKLLLWPQASKISLQLNPGSLQVDESAVLSVDSNCSDDIVVMLPMLIPIYLTYAYQASVNNLKHQTCVILA